MRNFSRCGPGWMRSLGAARKASLLPPRHRTHVIEPLGEGFYNGARLAILVLRDLGASADALVPVAQGQGRRWRCSRCVPVRAGRPAPRSVACARRRARVLRFARRDRPRPGTAARHPAAPPLLPATATLAARRAGRAAPAPAADDAAQPQGRRPRRPPWTSCPACCRATSRRGACSCRPTSSSRR